MNINKCSHYDSYLGTCDLYVEQVDEFDDLGWASCKCRTITDCDFKKHHLTEPK